MGPWKRVPSRRHIAGELAVRLRQACGASLDRVILFGSVARGTARGESDIDLLIVCRDRERIEERVWRLLGESLIETGVPVQGLVVSVPEFERLQRRGSELAHAIRDEGEVLA